MNSFCSHHSMPCTIMLACLTFLTGLLQPNDDDVRWVSPVAYTFSRALSPDGVTWLPDSSGFVFVSKDHAKPAEDLQLFNTTSKTRRTLVATTGTRTQRPAVSPDGKLVAVARLETYLHKPSSLCILFFDMQGKEQKRSSTFLWTPASPDWRIPADLPKGMAKKSPWFLPMCLEWDHTSQKVLVYESHVPFGGSQTTLGEGSSAIYNPATDQLLRIGAGYPGYCGGSAMVPNGQGILMIGEGVSLIKWDGERQLFAISNAVVEAYRKHGMLMPSSMSGGNSRWEGNTAIIWGTRGTVRIDTIQRVVTFDTRAEKKITLAKEFGFRRHTFPDSANQLGFPLENEIGSSEIQPSGNVQVVLLMPKSKQTRMILPRIRLTHMNAAPNGRYVAIRSEHRIHVIDSQGEIIANLDVNNKK